MVSGLKHIPGAHHVTLSHNLVWHISLELAKFASSFVQQLLCSSPLSHSLSSTVLLSFLDKFLQSSEFRRKRQFYFSRGNKYQLIVKSRLRDGTEPAVSVAEVAKQQDVFSGAIAFGVLTSAHASFWLDKKIWKLFECFHKDLPKPALVPPTDCTCSSFTYHSQPRLNHQNIVWLHRIGTSVVHKFHLYTGNYCLNKWWVFLWFLKNKNKNNKRINNK